ncbi:GNAT family N-acetyltransferase [Desmospora profundinema]|uniref:Ribosomal-protein-alanine N-acetyltransferase n=1 Tax=Desmospora profundinema TaxID=1571184 RepID=A0ABU1IMX8_9BACL|nr:GNAT family N-acetyltransferase [Desmospora profundinema]MDR6226126.1 ribosomal-protein-alanine N-acetyltransferase [Desmospora profundinema]
MNRVIVRRLGMDDVEAQWRLRLENRDFLRPYDPAREEDFFSRRRQEQLIRDSLRDWRQGRSYGFGVFLPENGRLIGRVNLSNVVRGAWHNATIGYFLDQRYTGKGLMRDAVRQVLDFAFTEAGLHRVEAGAMPSNRSSIRLLQAIGFRRIGLSPRHLKVNGRWEDHELYALTVEDWEGKREWVEDKKEWSQLG